MEWDDGIVSYDPRGRDAVDVQPPFPKRRSFLFSETSPCTRSLAPTRKSPTQTVVLRSAVPNARDDRRRARVRSTVGGDAAVHRVKRAGIQAREACKGISVRFVPAPRLGPPLPKRSAGRGGKASQGPGEECELPVCPGGSGCATRRLGSASLGRRASAEREDIALEEHGRSAARTAGPDAC
jgi:hypothetical protein